MKDNVVKLIITVLIYISAVVVILKINEEIQHKEKINTPSADCIVNCDVSCMTADAVTLECNVQYFHNESRSGMITPTVDSINSCLKQEIRLLTVEYSIIDFLNNREEIMNRIKAIPQQSNNKISSDFSWEILNITVYIYNKSLCG